MRTPTATHVTPRTYAELQSTLQPPTLPAINTERVVGVFRASAATLLEIIGSGTGVALASRAMMLTECLLALEVMRAGVSADQVVSGAAHLLGATAKQLGHNWYQNPFGAVSRRYSCKEHHVVADAWLRGWVHMHDTLMQRR